MANWQCERCGAKFSWGRPRTKRFELCLICHTEAVMPIFVNGKSMVPDVSEPFIPDAEPKLGKKKEDK